MWPCTVWCSCSTAPLRTHAAIARPSSRPCQAAKGKILNALAEADKNLVDGSDEFLQLLAAASYTQQVLMGHA